MVSDLGLIFKFCLCPCNINRLFHNPPKTENHFRAKPLTGLFFCELIHILIITIFLSPLEGSTSSSCLHDAHHQRTIFVLRSPPSLPCCERLRAAVRHNNTCLIHFLCVSCEFERGEALSASRTQQFAHFCRNCTALPETIISYIGEVGGCRDAFRVSIPAW